MSRHKLAKVTHENSSVSISDFVHTSGLFPLVELVVQSPEVEGLCVVKDHGEQGECRLQHVDIFRDPSPVTLDSGLPLLFFLTTPFCFLSSFLSRPSFSEDCLSFPTFPDFDFLRPILLLFLSKSLRA